MARNEFQSQIEKALSKAVMDAVSRERLRAHAKHDPNGGSMERLDWDDPRWLPVLAEEFGEVARVICERDLGNKSDLQSVSEIYEELIQLAAMTVAWAVASVDTYSVEDEDDEPEHFHDGGLAVGRDPDGTLSLRG